MGAHVVELDRKTPFTAARARNAGFQRLITMSNGLRYIQFVDGDCELIEGYLSEAVRFMEMHSEVAVLCGRRFERFPEASIFNKMCHHEWNTPVGEASSCGGDSIVRVTPFKEVGGFRNEQIAHEEPELCSRLRQAGHKIWRFDMPMALHDAGMSRVGQFYSRSRRAGFGITQYMDNASPGYRNDGSGIVIRALIWSIIPPALALGGAMLLSPNAFWFLLIYPAQIIRFAVKLTLHDYRPIEAFKVSTLSMIGRFAEAHGALEYLCKKLLRSQMRAILYK